MLHTFSGKWSLRNLSSVSRRSVLGVGSEVATADSSTSPSSDLNAQVHPSREVEAKLLRCSRFTNVCEAQDHDLAHKLPNSKAQTHSPFLHLAFRDWDRCATTKTNFISTGKQLALKRVSLCKRRVIAVANTTVRRGFIAGCHCACHKIALSAWA